MRCPRLDGGWLVRRWVALAAGKASAAEPHAKKGATCFAEALGVRRGARGCGAGAARVGRRARADALAPAAIAADAAATGAGRAGDPKGAKAAAREASELLARPWPT